MKRLSDNESAGDAAGLAAADLLRKISQQRARRANALFIMELVDKEGARVAEEKQNIETQMGVLGELGVREFVEGAINRKCAGSGGTRKNIELRGRHTDVCGGSKNDPGPVKGLCKESREIIEFLIKEKCNREALTELAIDEENKTKELLKTIQ